MPQQTEEKIKAFINDTEDELLSFDIQPIEESNRYSVVVNDKRFTMDERVVLARHLSRKASQANYPVEAIAE